MAANYFMCFLLTTLGEIWFSQHHNVYRVKSYFGAKWSMLRLFKWQASFRAWHLLADTSYKDSLSPNGPGDETRPSFLDDYV
jgi:hypothetical protein